MRETEIEGGVLRMNPNRGRIPSTNVSSMPGPSYLSWVKKGNVTSVINQGLSRYTHQQILVIILDEFTCTNFKERFVSYSRVEKKNVFSSSHHVVSLLRRLDQHHKSRDPVSTSTI